MLLIGGIIIVIITLFTIETHLKKVTKQNEEIIELLKNINGRDD